MLTLAPRIRYCNYIPAIVCACLLHGLVAANNLTAGQGADAGRLDALLQQGEQAETADRWDQALVSYQQALRLNPNSASAETKLAGVYYHRKEFDKALDYSGRALAAEPRNWEAAKLAGLAAFDLNRPDSAAKYFQQAIAVKSNDAESHYWLGMSLYSLRDARHALDEFYRARLYSPKDVEDLYMIGKIHWEMCRQAWEEMVRVDPDSIRVKQMVAEQEELRNLYPEAIAKYQEIIQQNPEAPGFHYALGKLYLHIAKFDDAAKAFQGELKLDSHNPLAYYGLGEVAFEQRNLTTALDDANSAIREKPDFGDAYVLRGRIEMNMGDKQRAMETLEHAAILSPSDPSLFYMLGRIYDDLGKHDLAAKAIATYQQLKNEQEREIQVAQ
jgi:tetratricopeptide (TPR) repeat protein